MEVSEPALPTQPDSRPRTHRIPPRDGRPVPVGWSIIQVRVQRQKLCLSPGPYLTLHELDRPQGAGTSPGH